MSTRNRLIYVGSFAFVEDNAPECELADSVEFGAGALAGWLLAGRKRKRNARAMIATFDGFPKVILSTVIHDISFTIGVLA